MANGGGFDPSGVGGEGFDRHGVFDRRGAFDRHGALDRHGADAANDAALAVLGAADRLRVETLRELVGVARTRSFVADGATSLTGWLRRRADMTDREAARTVRRVNVLCELPALAVALFGGDVSIGHLDALAEVATERRREAFDRFGSALVRAAATSSVDTFVQGCRHFAALADEHLCAPAAPMASGSLSFSLSLFGEGDMRGRLTSDQATAVGEAFAQLCDPDPSDAPVRRTLRERRADALADLATGFLDGVADGPTLTTRPRRAINPATVVVGLDELTGRSRGHSDRSPDDVDLNDIRRDLLAGGPIPARLAEHLSCDAAVRRLVVDPVGNPLNLGRATAVVSPSQRHALAIRDGGCAFPTCDRLAAWTDAHHIDHWAHGGATDVDNLILLCRHHHRLVHGAEWDIGRDPVTGVVTATRSDGRTYTRAGPPHRSRPPEPPHPPEPPDPPV